MSSIKTYGRSDHSPGLLSRRCEDLPLPCTPRPSDPFSVLQATLYPQPPGIRDFPRFPEMRVSRNLAKSREISRTKGPFCTAMPPASSATQPTAALPARSPQKNNLKQPKKSP